MTILLPPPKTVYVKLILTEKLVSEPEKKGTIDKELWPYSQSFVRRPCRRRDEGGREGGPPTNSGSASSVSSARPPARASMSVRVRSLLAAAAAIKVKGKRPSCSGQLNLAYGGREGSEGGRRRNGRARKRERERSLREKPWKLPSELVVSAISSVAAIFMVAISRLHGWFAR